MKDQYFGDVNDFRKYALLRSLVKNDRLRLGVCWMLTEPGARADGKFLSYLDKPKRFRDSDPELFDWLKLVFKVADDSKPDRRTNRIEGSPLLGSASFQTGFLPASNSERIKYFTAGSSRLNGCDLVFFDPDNGLQIESAPLGHKNSKKFLFWEEACNTFSSKSSILIYQHFNRQTRPEFVARLTAELQKRTGAAAVFSFKTPHVVFLLASQEPHVEGFRRRLADCRTRWAQAGIEAQEHPLLKTPLPSNSDLSV